MKKEELLNIAKLSGIHMPDDEVSLFTEQIQKVLGFINQLQEVQVTTTATSTYNENVLRDDMSTQTSAASPLQAAPELQNGYFVVPTILEEK